MTSDPLDGCDGYRLVRPSTGPAPFESVLARHAASDEDVLVRVFPTDATVSESTLETLRALKEALAGLDHPNIAEIIEVGHTPAGKLFVATRFADCRVLRELLGESKQRLPVVKVLELAAGALRGLEAAHEIGIVHGALSLDTLCVCTSSRSSPSAQRSPRLLKLLDLGLAAAVKHEPMHPGAPDDGSIAPPSGPSVEPSVDPRLDVFLAGAVLYELLAGRAPFTEPAAAANHPDSERPQPAPPSRYSTQDTGPQLDSVVLRSLEPDPDDRYQTPAAFGVAIDRVATLLRQVSLPGSLHLGDAGYSVDVPSSPDSTPPPTSDAAPSPFSPAPDLSGSGEAAATELAEAVVEQDRPAPSVRPAPRTLIAVVAVAFVAAIALLIYLVN